MPTKYIALVSHDDEQEVVPIGVTDKPQQAKDLCIKYAQDNGDHWPPTRPFNWCMSEHSRIDGEFWDWVYVNQHNEQYKYFVRPVPIQN